MKISQLTDKCKSLEQAVILSLKLEQNIIKPTLRECDLKK